MSEVKVERTVAHQMEVLDCLGAEDKSISASTRVALGQALAEAEARGRAAERAAIVAWLVSLYDQYHTSTIAMLLEDGEHINASDTDEPTSGKEKSDASGE